MAEPARITARSAALGLLNGVLAQHKLLSDLLAGGALDALPPSDRARAQRLALETLRHIEPIDRLLTPRFQKPPPLKVRSILRLAVSELAGGAAAHGVVNESVDLARADPATANFAGLVNAVLRAVGPAPVLQGSQNLPKWLHQRLVSAYGKGAVGVMEQVFSKSPPVDLTLREGRPIPPGAVRLPTGSFRLSADPGQISALPGYDTGDWWVQDAAAALAAQMLDAKKGERVLDLCAAPGGKTLQLAASGAIVTALDLSDARLTRLRENLARTGLSAEIVVADALTWAPLALYDAILLDAPCSATGTIRRHPDLPFVKDGSDLATLTQLQAKLLDRALSFLKPGGRLVYCTCSLLPEEGERQLEAAMNRNPGLRVDPPKLMGLPKTALTKTGALRLRPDHWAEKGGMDGFYIVRVRMR
jgi:16S rRNA (cytosine967-C5)-methyltransferase